MSIAIVTDTNSGIGETEAERLGIYVMPMPVIIDDEVFFEGVDLTAETLCLLLDKGRKVSTSQPSPGDVVDCWEKVLNSEYDELLYIPMSSGLSSSCSTAKVLAEAYGGKVYVVDNHRVSVTLRTAVMKATKLVAEGKTAREIAEYLEADAYNSSIYVAVDKLDCLKRGGRITPAAATLASILNIKPVLTIQGEKLDSYAKVRGSMRRCEAKMIDGVKMDMDKRFSQSEVETIHIGVAGFGISEKERDYWLNLAKKEFPEADVYYDSLPASIGTHTGPGAVGIGISVDYKK